MSSFSNLPPNSYKAWAGLKYVAINVASCPLVIGTVGGAFAGYVLGGGPFHPMASTLGAAFGAFGGLMIGGLVGDVVADTARRNQVVVAKPDKSAARSPFSNLSSNLYKAWTGLKSVARDIAPLAVGVAGGTILGVILAGGPFAVAPVAVTFAALGAFAGLGVGSMISDVIHDIAWRDQSVPTRSERPARAPRVRIEPKL